MPMGPLVVPDADDAWIEVLPLRWRRIQMQIVQLDGSRVAASIDWQEAIELGERMIEIARIAGGLAGRPGAVAGAKIAMRELLTAMVQEVAPTVDEDEDDEEEEVVELEEDEEEEGEIALPAPAARRMGRPPAVSTGRFAAMSDDEIAAVSLRDLDLAEREQRRMEMVRRSARRQYDRVRKRPREVAT